MAAQNVPEEDLLLELAEKVSGDWYKLGINLGIPSQKLTSFAQPARPPTFLPRLMLDTWIERQGGEENIPRQKELELKEKLKKQLLRCSRRDLSEKVLDNKRFSEIFTELMGNLINIWERLGVFLGFSVSELDQMKGGSGQAPKTSEVSKEVLLHWRNNSKSRTYVALIEGLKRIRRMDLVNFVENSERYQEYLRSMVRQESHAHNQHPSDFSSQQPRESQQRYDARQRSRHPQQAWQHVQHPQPSAPGMGEVIQTQHQVPLYSQPPVNPGFSHPGAHAGNLNETPTTGLISMDAQSYQTQGANPSFTDGISSRGHVSPTSVTQAHVLGLPGDQLQSTNFLSYRDQASDPSMEDDQDHRLSLGVDNPDSPNRGPETRGLNSTALPLQPSPSPRLQAVSSAGPDDMETHEDEPPEERLLHDPGPVQKEVKTLNPRFAWMARRMEVMRRESVGTKSPVIVALLDSGVNDFHPDLKKANMVIHKMNFVPNEKNDLVFDKHDHGTGSAGILWQYSPEVKILNLKVLRHNGTGNLRYPSRALQYIKNWDELNPMRKVDVILMPFGQQGHHEDLENLIDDLSQTKVILCSASNSGQREANTITFPANHGKVIAIGSCNEYGGPCNHSGVGQQLSFLFPGCGITTTSSYFYMKPEEKHRYKEVDGTSFATPHAGALVAVILAFIEKKISREMRKVFTNSRIMKKLLMETCRKGFTVTDGHGIPEVDRLTELMIKDFIQREGLERKVQIRQTNA